MRYVLSTAAIVAAALMFATTPAWATPSATVRQYHWQTMSLTQRIHAQRQLVIDDWRIITTWRSAKRRLVTSVPMPRSVYWHYQHMKWTQRELQESLRQLRAVARATTAPSIGASPWDGVARCESGGNWGEVTGNGFYWGLQWVPSTWDSRAAALGLPNWQWFMDHHAAPSRDMQIRAATGMALSNWPVCQAYYNRS